MSYIESVKFLTAGSNQDLCLMRKGIIPLRIVKALRKISQQIL